MNNRFYRSPNVTRSALLILCVFLVSTSVYASQTGTLSGSVRNPRGEALSRAEITLFEKGCRCKVDCPKRPCKECCASQRFAEVNDVGEFRITNIPVGEYIVGVDAFEYEPFVAEVSIEFSQTLNLNVTLEPKQYNSDVIISSGNCGFFCQIKRFFKKVF